MSPLTLIFLIPLLTAVVLVFVPARQVRELRGLSLAGTGIPLILAVLVFVNFDKAALGPGTVAGLVPGPAVHSHAPSKDASPAVFLEHKNGYKFTEARDWMPSLGIGYHVGVDGLNVGLLLMGALVAFAAVCCARDIKRRVKEFHILLLLMTSGILGAFVSLDIFLMYFLHELALVPTFIMIGVWGHGEDKNYAAIKITLYLSLGALLALAGLILLYTQAGAHTFDLLLLIDHAGAGGTSLTPGMQETIFGLLLFGLGILVSLWPFHTWAPLGYAAAPTATAMMHAGVIKKFGLYMLLRVALPLLPDGAQHWAGLLAILALGNLLWCGLVALRQKDFTRMLGNSSVAHMGFVFLGIASLNLIGITGAVLVMIAHGLLAALAFGLSGHLYRQTGSLDMSRMGGLLRQMPLAGSALLMALFAGCGLPGFANFAGEVTIFFAAWAAGLKTITVIAAWSALVIGGLYMMRAIRNILHGPRGGDWAKASDVSPLIATALGLLLAALLVFGFAPWLLTNGIEDEVKKSVLLAKPSAAASQAQATEAAGR